MSTVAPASMSNKLLGSSYKERAKLYKDSKSSHPEEQSESGIGTLRKPRRPAPGKPVPAKAPPISSAPVKCPELKKQVSKLVQSEPYRLISGPSRPAPPRPLNFTPKNDINNKVLPAEVQGLAGTWRANGTENLLGRKDSDNLVSRQRSREEEVVSNSKQHNDRDAARFNGTELVTESGKASNNQDSELVTEDDLPFASNKGFFPPEEDNNFYPTGYMLDSDTDESHFFGGAESFPQDKEIAMDLILEPPKHFSESSLNLEGRLDEAKTDSIQRNAKTKVSVQSNMATDNSGLIIQFLPPEMSHDKDAETNFSDLEFMLQQEQDSTKHKKEEQRKEKKSKKKKKAKHGENGDGTKVKTRKKKKIPTEHGRQSEQKEFSLLEYMYPELDGVQSHENPTSTKESYHSYESLKTDIMGRPMSRVRRHKTNYRDIVATDEYTPPWLVDEELTQEEAETEAYEDDKVIPNIYHVDWKKLFPHVSIYFTLLTHF